MTAVRGRGCCMLEFLSTCVESSTSVEGTSGDGGITSRRGSVLRHRRQARGSSRGAQRPRSCRRDGARSWPPRSTVLGAAGQPRADASRGRPRGRTVRGGARSAYFRTREALLGALARLRRRPGWPRTSTRWAPDLADVPGRPTSARWREVSRLFSAVARRARPAGWPASSSPWPRPGTRSWPSDSPRGASDLVGMVDDVHEWRGRGGRRVRAETLVAALDGVLLAALVQPPATARRPSSRRVARAAAGRAWARHPGQA